MSDDPVVTSLTGATTGLGRTVGQRSAGLLSEALASDDAEESGVRAGEVLADPGRALAVLGRPDGPASARHAVVQRYGRVGALLVIGYEERWRRTRVRGGAGPVRPGREPGWVGLLDQLVDGFGALDAPGMDHLLAEFDRAEGLAVHGDAVSARRWLHATYAVAARDGSDPAHRAYMDALDRVMRLAAPRIAS